jgi:DNA-binding transcriptional ArsR family regulator/uncharacterized protein YndB with AHSA1/START domain
MSPKIHPLAPLDPLETVWRALADPTRRGILDLLRKGPQTTGAVAAAFPQSRFAAMKHLDVLVAAGLVTIRREGRERWNQLNPIPLQRVYERWVRPYEAQWAVPFVRLKGAIESAQPQPPQTALTSQYQPLQPQSPGAASMTDNRSTSTETPPPACMLTVSLEIPIAATPARVWQALTEQMELWWPADFRAATDSLHMSFDATIGGRILEQGKNGSGVIWYTVYGIAPGVSVDMVGQLSPAFGGPAQSLLRLELREQGHQTMLVLTDAVVGNVGARSAESLQSGWKAIFDDAFKSFVESAGESS